MIILHKFQSRQEAELFKIYLFVNYKINSEVHYNSARLDKRVECPAVVIDSLDLAYLESVRVAAKYHTAELFVNKAPTNRLYILNKNDVFRHEGRIGIVLEKCVSYQGLGGMLVYYEDGTMKEYTQHSAEEIIVEFAGSGELKIQFKGF